MMKVSAISLMELREVGRSAWQGGLIALLVFLTGCATTLTDPGRRIKVVPTGDKGAVSDCVQLGPVTGKAGSVLSGGEYGVFYAGIDARNRTAHIPGADTLLITDNRERTFGGEISGVAYNCNNRGGNPLQKSVTAPAAAPVAGPVDDIFAKAKKCQTRGGVWVNNQCVIRID